MSQMTPNRAKPNSKPLATPRVRVLQWLQRAIEEGQIQRGEAIPSERAIAKFLGVAQNTAAAALDEAESRGIVFRRSPSARKRFVPDAAASSVVANATIYVMGEPAFAPDGSPAPRWTDRFLSMEAVARLSATGRHVMVLNSDVLSAAAVDDLFRAPPAAMLILSTVAGHPIAMRALEHCRAASVPVVVHGNAPDLRAFDRIYTDHRATGRDLTRWLLARGRKRIVPFFPYMPETFWASERLAGYADAMREAGLASYPCAVFGTALPDDTPPAERFRVRRALAVAKLLELGCGRGTHLRDRGPDDDGPSHHRGPDDAGPSHACRPDALLCLSDNWARVAVAAMRDLGLVPHRDILVVGHDNIAPGAEFGAFEADAPDATIDKHNETKAAALAALLAARLAGELPPEPQCRTHAFELVTREGAIDRNRKQSAADSNRKPSLNSLTA